MLRQRISANGLSSSRWAMTPGVGDRNNGVATAAAASRRLSFIPTSAA
jgi:hypothetical protein